MADKILSMMMRMAGRTFNNEAKGLSVEEDPNSEGVLRVVDAAPFAYNPESDTLKTENGEMVGQLRDLIGYQRLILKQLGGIDPVSVRQAYLNLPDLLVFYAMQENGGNSAIDSSPNRLNGTYINAVLGLDGPNSEVYKMVQFNANGMIEAPMATSVKGLGMFTFTAIVNVKHTPVLKNIWFEPVPDARNLARFQLCLTASNALGVWVRTGNSTQSSGSVVSTTAIPQGHCILHAKIDLINSTIELYRNGVKLATTGSIDYGEAIADTLPIIAPRFGLHGDGNSGLGSEAAFAALYTRKLTDSEITNQASKVGFAL